MSARRIFAGHLSEPDARGTCLPLTVGLREIVQSITTRFGRGPRVTFAISANTRAP